MVGSPNHKSLWVLAKSVSLAPDVLDGIKAQAAAQGFDPAKLVLIPQKNAADALTVTAAAAAPGSAATP
jgi:lipocalin